MELPHITRLLNAVNLHFDPYEQDKINSQEVVDLLRCKIPDDLAKALCLSTGAAKLDDSDFVQGAGVSPSCLLISCNTLTIS